MKRKTPYRNLIIITSTSLRAAGKSTLFKLLRLFLDDPAGVLFAEVSDILKWRAAITDDIGAQISELVPKIMNNGLYMPNELVLRSIDDFLQKELQANPLIKLVLLSGLPRRKGQGAILDEFQAALILHMKTTLEETLANAKRRRDGGEYRADDDPDKIQNNWNEYTEHTVPALELYKDVVIHLDRSTPLLERFRKVIESLPIDPARKTELLLRLEDPEEQIHREIYRIEHPPKKDVHAAHAARDVVYMSNEEVIRGHFEQKRTPLVGILGMTALPGSHVQDAV